MKTPPISSPTHSIHSSQVIIEELRDDVASFKSASSIGGLREALETHERQLRDLEQAVRQGGGVLAGDVLQRLSLLEAEGGHRSPTGAEDFAASRGGRACV